MAADTGGLFPSPLSTVKKSTFHLENEGLWTESTAGLDSQPSRKGQTGFTMHNWYYFTVTIIMFLILLKQQLQMTGVGSLQL